MSRQKQAFVDASTFRCKAARYCLETAGIAEKDVGLIIGGDNIESRYYARFGPRIRLMNHHLAHAASSFYPSPFTEAAVLVADGRGSYLDKPGKIVETVTYYTAQGTSIREIQKRQGLESADFRNVSNSIGLFYLAVTEELGFGPMYDDKTMALAAYGTDRYVEAFRAFYSMDDGGEFSQTLGHLEQQREFIRAELNQAVREAADSSGGCAAKADLAYAAQYHLEEVLIRACRYLYAASGCENLCLAGGVFSNRKAVSRLLKEIPFKRMYIPPAPGDAGTAIGSALYAHYVLGGHPRRVPPVPPAASEPPAPFAPTEPPVPSELPAPLAPTVSPAPTEPPALSVPPKPPVSPSLDSPYLGRDYGEEDYAKAVRTCRDQLEEIPAAGNLNRAVAQLLIQGGVVGLFRGRSEFGSQSLGNRSIVADARSVRMKERLDAAKGREAFRPLSSAALEGDPLLSADPGTAVPYGCRIPRPAKAERVSCVPAILQADGTADVQAVTAGLSTELTALLEAYRGLADSSLLVNTSFNADGEPMVETPEEAIRCFLKLGLDYLVLDNRLFTKR
ncbi:carbamoyltransferase C-terminal domain-containing protein [Paenibacillus sp. FJAT-26967]|uniref:carbamoyltransferase C-terminal domain-containing protein n=1 Tax=Paenibacillus sp. FJAT-26967 TaxID=1729690 RepID=UPI000AE72191|nr:carbamoyltransferase C-terminal domain-containing protein [Paenibacillus sp. FJAT-26967]